VTLDLPCLDQEQEDGQERKSAISLRFLKHFRLVLLLKNWLGIYCEHWRLVLYLPCIVGMTYTVMAKGLWYSPEIKDRKFNG
jgi:hypothetical protein